MFQIWFIDCNFQSLNHHWSVLLDQIPLQLDRKGIKESEDGMRGGEGGDYSWEVIILDVSIKGGRLFEGGNYSRDGYYSRKYGTLNWTPCCLWFLVLINVSFVLKSDTNHSTFPFSLPCPMFSLDVGHKLRLHFVETDIVLSETRFPYLLENLLDFVSVVFELCVKVSINLGIAQFNWNYKVMWWKGVHSQTFRWYSIFYCHPPNPTKIKGKTTKTCLLI